MEIEFGFCYCRNGLTVTGKQVLYRIQNVSPQLSPLEFSEKDIILIGAGVKNKILISSSSFSPLDD